MKKISAMPAQDRMAHAGIPRRVEADMADVKAASLGPDADAVSRRAVLTAAAALTFGVAAGCMVSERATAQVKVTQDEALYQDHPRGDQSCGVCYYFQPPSACRIVPGTISPRGWCTLFAKT